MANPVTSLVRWLQRLHFRTGPVYNLGRPVSDVFRRAYSKRHWGEGETVSGEGSRLTETAAVREALPGLLKDLRVRSMLDAPCGDFNWMRTVNLDLDLYIGGDIVPEIIADVRAKDGAPGREFVVLDLIADTLPKVDLILCRDCLVHLSMANIRRALDNFRRSGSTWLLTTSFPGTMKKNRDIINGGWRAIDLQVPPFSLPAPVRVIDERADRDQERGKVLALWRIADITA